MKINSLKTWFFLFKKRNYDRTTQSWVTVARLKSNVLAVNSVYNYQYNIQRERESETIPFQKSNIKT